MRKRGRPKARNAALPFRSGRLTLSPTTSTSVSASSEACSSAFMMRPNVSSISSSVSPKSVFTRLLFWKRGLCESGTCVWLKGT